MPECITHTLAVSPMNFSGGRLYECICVKATYNIKVIVTVIYKVHSTIKATAWHKLSASAKNCGGLGSLLSVKKQNDCRLLLSGTRLDWRNATRAAHTPLSLSCVSSSFFLPADILTRPLSISIRSSPLLYHVLLLQVLKKLPPLDTLHQNLFSRFLTS